jgi:SAM-dependent methyltransferase
MNKSLLVNLFGFHATLIHGDTLVLDRWRWLKERLPATRNGEKLLDVGCGTGAFSIGAARRGYEALGLSWDERNQAATNDRAAMCKVPLTRFEVQDVRRLHERRDLVDAFDVAICFENVEHVMDDRKLISDIARCLKPGGRLLLTAPFFHYRPMTAGDLGPFSRTEDGGHVRRGYTKAMLEELCQNAGLVPEQVSYCSGFFSQKITALMRVLQDLHPLVGWALVLPLRVFPPLLDGLVASISRWPGFSICIEAYKPRFSEKSSALHGAPVEISRRSAA